MTGRYNSEEESTDFINCSECLDTFHLDQGECCIYSEDWYCVNHYRKHMEKKHHFYFTKVLQIKTHHKAGTVNKCNALIKEFQRQGKIIMTGIYWYGDEPKRKVPKFDYTEMTGQMFMIHHYPKFIEIKGRDDSQASREASC